MALHLYVHHYGNLFLYHVLFAVPYAAITKHLFDIATECYYVTDGNCLRDNPLDYATNSFNIIGLFIATAIAQWFLHATPFYPRFHVHLGGFIVVLFPYLVMKSNIDGCCDDGGGNSSMSVVQTYQCNMLYIAQLWCTLGLYISHLYGRYCGARYMLRQGSPGCGYDYDMRRIK